MPMPKSDERDVYRCPICKQKLDPVATDRTHEDTDGIECRVFECPNPDCEYEEGRPIEKPAEEPAV